MEPVSSDHGGRVLCAACGAWFEHDRAAGSVECPLCRAPLVVGPARRVRRRVVRTGDVAGAPSGGGDERRGLLRVLAVCALGFVALLVLAAAIVVVPAIADRVAARISAEDR